jgi:O-antigen ligase
VLVIGGALAVVASAAAVSTVGAERLAVLGGGPNVFGRMMGYAALASLYYWRRSGYTLVFLPAVSVSALLVLLSGSRGSLVALVISIATFVILEVRSLRRLASMAIVVAVFSWCVVTYTEVGQAAVRRYDERVQGLLVQDRYSAGRDHLYRSAYELGLSEPVWGAGLAAFPGLGLGVYPHNVFLEVFCEGGSIGLVLLLLAFGLSVPPLMRGGRDGAVLAGLVLSFVASQFSGDYYDSRGVFAFLMIAVSLRREEAYEERKTGRPNVVPFGARVPASRGARAGAGVATARASYEGDRSTAARRTHASRRQAAQS